MKTIRKHTILCILLIAALVAQCSAVAFAVSPYPEVYYLVGGEPDADGNIIPEYWVDSHGNRLKETTGRVRAQTELPSSYDLRNYGLVTPVKHQAGAGSCWAFATISSLESNYIRQGFGTLADTDFSEAHLAWFAQRQRTTDTTDPTYGDGKMCAQPFTTGGNWNASSATLMRGVGLQLEQNAPWIVTYDTNTLMQMEQPESDRYVSYARMWSVSAIRDKSAAALKQKIMQNGVAILSYYDDYSTTRTGYSSDRSSYYQTAQTNLTNHAVSVVGWDDNYPRTNFNANQRPSSNGAWLVKGSWSSSWGQNGYYWISYEDPSLNEFASFVAAPADIYDHIYQYDGSYPKISFSIPNSGKMANVFTAERDELLTHVAFFSPNVTPIKVTAEIYVAPDDFLYFGTHPTDGFNKVDAATTTVNGVEYGYSTIELASPTLLTKGQVFSVVLTMELNGSTVMIPAEGQTVNNPGDGIETYSGSVGDSFLGYSGYWYDTNAYPNGVDYNNVPLKAMTRDVTLTDPTLSIVSMPTKTTYRVGESPDLAGLSLLYTNEYGIAQTVTSGFTCSPETFSSFGVQPLTVQYGGLSVTFNVTVEPYETSLSLQTAPDKTTYLFGEALDTTGLSLLYTDEYGITQTVTSGFVYYPLLFSALGTQTVTVTYGGRNVSFDVTVEPHEPTLTVLTQPDKATYLYGETLDTTGLSLLYADEYGVRQDVTEGYVCDTQTLRALGTQTVTVYYNNLSTTFDVTVEPHEPTLSILSVPDKTSYRIRERLNTTGLSLLYTDEYGAAQTVTDGFTYDPQSFRAAGIQTVTVTYAGLQVTFDVTVELFDTTLALSTLPDKTTYRVGDALDTTGLSLLYTDEYGVEQTVTDGFVCSPMTLRTIGTQTILVMYGALSVNFDVTVEPYEKTLSIWSTPTKTLYHPGEPLDTTGLTLLYTDEYGDSLAVTAGYTCTPETFSALGTQSVTVTYDGLSVTYDVTVELYEPTLTVLTPPDKTTYLYGETLDLTGLQLQFMNEYGALQVVTDGYSCDTETLTTFGTQAVTVQYNGLSAQFDVTVEPHQPTLTVEAVPSVTLYHPGQALDTDGLSLIFTDEYGISVPVTEGYTCDPQSFDSFGWQTVTVTYGEYSTTFNVYVEPFEPTLTLQFAPQKMSYLVGESLDTTGLTLFYTDEYGDALIVTEGYVVEPDVFGTAGVQTVTVSYNGLFVTFDVTVEQSGYFIVSEETATPGETVEIAVRISDNPGIVATWLELSYDRDVLTLEGVDNGEVFADADFTPGNDLTAMPFRVLFLDALGGNHTQNGVLVVFTFRVRTDARPGESTIELTFDADNTYDVNLDNVLFDVRGGVFTVRRMPGDVNADGKINLKDAVVLRRYLAGWDVTINTANADVDQSEGVTLKDVTCICRYLAGGHNTVLL